jgi:hypothetical protein
MPESDLDADLDRAAAAAGGATATVADPGFDTRDRRDDGFADPFEGAVPADPTGDLPGSVSAQPLPDPGDQRDRL